MAAVVRVRKVVNPRKRRRKLSAAQLAAGFGGKRGMKRSSSTSRSSSRRRKRRGKAASGSRSNPALVVTLGPTNPSGKKGSKSMAKRRRSTKRRSTAVARGRRSNPRRRRVVRRRRTRRASNPNLFGATVSGGKLAQAVVGGLVGVTATKVIVPALPMQLTSTPLMRSLSSVGVAFGAGWLATKVDKTLGSAVLFGGLMQAGSVLLNAFVPQIGGSIALSGLGDFVPASFPMPQNPVSAGMYRALPAASGNGVSGLRAGAFRGAFA